MIDGREARAPHLRLLKGFELVCDGVQVSLPVGGQRLLAFLALKEFPQSRSYVAGSLWLDSSDERSNASLRSTLWRVGRVAGGVICCRGGELQLAPEVSVDARALVDLSHQLIQGDRQDGPAEPTWSELTGELLPGWYEDWVLLERERLRQLSLHALETLCTQLSARGRFAEAIEAGLAAVGGEPLRESAHRALIAAHLAEGNRNEALRQYRSYEGILRKELGLTPSPQMQRLVGV